jgi:hypothetical protein
MKGYLIQWSPPTPRQPDGATIDFRATDKLKLKNAPKKADVEFELFNFYLQRINRSQSRIFEKNRKISMANFEILDFSLFLAYRQDNFSQHSPIAAASPFEQH